jgi:flagellar biosynthesis/type III secretory pathway protein FliH
MRKEMAQQRTDVVAKAEAQGYADGAKRGEAEGRAVLEREASRLRGVIDDLQHARQSMLEGAEDMLVEIVFAAVARLVGHPAGGREAALHAIQASARALGADDALTVLVHPADLDFLKEQAGTMDNVVLRASPVVELGGCMIDGAGGTLDARLETQLERLRQTLVDARALRRQDAQT